MTYPFLSELRWTFISEAKCEWSLKQSSLAMQCTQIKWMNGWTFLQHFFIISFFSFQNSASFCQYLFVHTFLCVYWYGWWCRQRILDMTMTVLYYLIFVRGSLILYGKSHSKVVGESDSFQEAEKHHYSNWEMLSDCHKTNRWSIRINLRKKECLIFLLLNGVVFAERVIVD